MFKSTLIRTLKKTICTLEEDLDRANFKIENRDKLIKSYREEQETLLNNVSELRAKIIDLENNIEFLTNNSSDKKIKRTSSDFETKLVHHKYINI